MQSQVLHEMFAEDSVKSEHERAVVPGEIWSSGFGVAQIPKP